MNERQKTLLAIETAARGGSLAVWRDGEIVAEWFGAADFSASQGLLSEIENVLRTVEIGIETVDSLAVATGPGNFTGLRVGLATARGLATALSIPVRGVPTFAAVARLSARPNLNCCILPAGRSEVFFQLFRVAANGDAQAFGEIQLAKNSEFFLPLKNEPQLNFIAPPEIKILLDEFIRSEKLNDWTTNQTPHNPAIGVARVALERNAADNNDFADDLRLIYGREAQIGQPKTAAE